LQEKVTGMSAVIPFVHQLSESEATAWLNVLHPLLPNAELLPFSALTPQQCQQVEVAIVANPQPADLAALPNLRWVQSLWAGVERLLTETQDAEFAIVRMTDPQLAVTMAEAVLAWTLYLHRDMPRYRAQQTARVWQPHPVALPSEQTVGILGLGNLGRASAQTLVQQGFDVWGWGRSPQMLDRVICVSGSSRLQELLERSQILICLLPLTPQTQGLLNYQTLSDLPHGASLINFARGPIVDTDALIHHLDSGHIAHAVLDVFEIEPLPIDSPLWSHPSITILPHISAPTHRQTASKIVANHIHTFLQTGAIPPAVDRVLGY
jgi:glyoxylate/hydroxypyruvate reductase A